MSQDKVGSDNVVKNVDKSIDKNASGANKSNKAPESKSPTTQKPQSNHSNTKQGNDKVMSAAKSTDSQTNESKTSDSPKNKDSVTAAKPADGKNEATKSNQSANKNETSPSNVSPKEGAHQKTQPNQKVNATPNKGSTNEPAHDKSSSANASEKTTSQTASPNKEKSSSGKGLASTALIASLVALGGSAYVFTQNKPNPELAQLPSQVSQLNAQVSDLTNQQSELSAQVHATSSSFNDLSNAIAAQETNVANQLVEASDNAKADFNREVDAAKATINQEIEALQATLNNSQVALAQSKDLLMLRNAIALVEGADHQLMAFSSPKSAHQALQLAQNLLSTIGPNSGVSSTAIADATQALTIDITQLNDHVSAEKEDVPASILEGIEQVSSLAIRQSNETAESNDLTPNAAESSDSAEIAANSTTSADQPWYMAMKDKVVDTAGTISREIVEDLGRVITVEDISEKGDEAFIPEEEYFLRENLILQLQNAQQAWLQKQDELFVANINGANQWLNNYFDTNAENVKNLMAKLSHFSTLSSTVTLPNINQSINAFDVISQEIDAIININSGSLESSLNTPSNNDDDIDAGITGQIIGDSFDVSILDDDTNANAEIEPIDVKNEALIEQMPEVSIENVEPDNNNNNNNDDATSSDILLEGATENGSQDEPSEPLSEEPLSEEPLTENQ